MKSFKSFLKSKLSVKQRIMIRTLINFFTSPSQFESNMNYLKYANQLLESTKISFVPPVFSVAITDSCNLRCPSCLFLLENEKRFFSSNITVENFKQILEKYNNRKNAQVIFLSGGEPLLHPDIDKLIEISIEYGLIPKMSTNGILLKNKINALKKVKYINISLDSYDEDSFKKYRGGTSKQFGMIKDGLNAIKENNNYFSVSFLLSKENISEIDKMLSFANEIKPNFLYFHNINPHGCSSYHSLTKNDQATEYFLKKIMAKTDYPFDIHLPVIFDTDSPIFREVKCIQPWYYFCYNSVGDIAFCCHLSPSMEIGNAFKNYDFNSVEMIKFRSNIISGKLPESCLYCQRRFMGYEYGQFNSKEHRWILTNS